MNIKYEYIKSKVEDFMKQSEIYKFDKGFQYFTGSLIGGEDFNHIDITEHYEADVDGGQDKQIDSIYISEFEDKIYFKILQVKTSKGFKSNDVILIKSGLDWIFKKKDNSLDELTNKKFASKIREIREIWKKNYKKINVEVYYITLGSRDDISETDEINQEINTINESYENMFSTFSFELIGVSEIDDTLELVDETAKKINYEFEIIDDRMGSIFIEKETDDFKTLVFTTKGQDIANLVRVDKNKVLFDKNIRKYLNKTSSVNKDIINTCGSENSSLFWYLNNGITIVCDSFDIKKIPNRPCVNVMNLQIVNGCQTSVSLFNAFEDNKLNEDVEVLVKLHRVSNKKMLDLITISTNNQNPINQRDLVANDKIQVELEKIYLELFDFYYERKRNQYNDLDRELKKKIIKNDKIGQSFLAIAKCNPAKALGSKTKVFTEEYDSIYKLEYADKLLFSILIWNFCESMKKQVDDIVSLFGDTESVVELTKKGSYHISVIMSNFVLDNGNIYEIKTDEMKKNIDLLLTGKFELYDIYISSFRLLLNRINSSKAKNKSVFAFLKLKESNTLCTNIITELKNELSVVEKIQ